MSYPVGASGATASIIQIAAVLLYDDSVRLIELSSFLVLSPEHLFADITRDGKYEFIMFTRLTCEETGQIFYSVQVFSLDKNGAKNITEDVKNIPQFVQTSSGILQVVKEIPKCFGELPKSEHPSVLLNR
ncbi:MAG: hypothetical protein PHO37_19145 [Kiritimatiellae bacterium]|nr:hypothetical protein [Kiritimatiellia bacterium]